MPAGRLVTLAWLAFVITSVTAPGCARDSAHDRRAATASYEVDAAGAPAVESGRWTVRFPSDQPAGGVSGIARCGDTAFLVDTRLAVVFRVHLQSGTVRGTVGEHELVEPSGIAADCETGRLYVAGLRTVFSYRISDGVLLRKYGLPSGTFLPRGILTLSADRSDLLLPALWAPEDRNTNALDAFFVGHKLGLRLSLGDGRSEPLSAPISVGCRSLCCGCERISVDLADGSRDGRLLVSQGQSRDVKVSRPGDAAGVLIDVRSPLFLSDGTTLPRGADFDSESRWGRENSYIDSAMVFGARIATIHVRERGAKGDRRATRFSVFMNLHSLNGEPLACDIALPDVPVGRDRESLYIADYEPEGRSSALTSVNIVRVVPDVKQGNR